jgi:hypothetical protein
MHWIFAHLIGDYLLQNDWMAKGKKGSSLVCLAHVATYMMPFLFIGAAWWQLLAIAAQHFAQDRTKVVNWFLNATGKADFAKPPMAPWSIIVVDNTFHVLFIAAILAI